MRILPRWLIEANNGYLIYQQTDALTLFRLSQIVVSGRGLLKVITYAHVTLFDEEMISSKMSTFPETFYRTTFAQMTVVRTPTVGDVWPKVIR